MADPADIAGENDFTEEILRRHRSSDTSSKIRRGSCLSCEEVLAPDQIFCDTYCRAQYEHDSKMKSIQRR
jgi:hypothetical protein